MVMGDGDEGRELPAHESSQQRNEHVMHKSANLHLAFAPQHTTTSPTQSNSHLATIRLLFRSILNQNAR